ncbi:leucine-rich repeat-containing protein 70-like [Heterodontus francisci]|uniref:leucine-rich repeat-containing protein 70-like n=1 Tax=Heterodontus francisci TaxID=7792 RepID=UPI00355B92ED
MYELKLCSLGRLYHHGVHRWQDRRSPHLITTRREFQSFGPRQLKARPPTRVPNPPGLPWRLQKWKINLQDIAVSNTRPLHNGRKFSISCPHSNRAAETCPQFNGPSTGCRSCSDNQHPGPLKQPNSSLTLPVTLNGFVPPKLEPCSGLPCSPTSANMALFGIILCSVTLVLYFTLAVESVALSVDIQCPTGCTCHSYYKHINCANVSLGDFPTKLLGITTQLQISSGHLPVIPVDAFLNLSSLTTLYLSSNNVKEVRPGAFNGLNKLQFLHLDNNSIEELQVGVFEDVTTVTYLHLENNLIANLTPGVFSSMRKLNVLYFSNNRLTVLYDRTFRSLSALRWLFLSNNQITVIASKAFTGNKALRTLYLDSNKLTAVPTDAIRSLKRLSILQLSNNNISRLNSGSFGQKLRSLERLYLDNTSLKEAPSEAFSKFRKLEVLSMKSNRLVTLTFSKAFQSVSNFGLSGNDWRCDCGLIWLRDWLLKQNATEQNEVTCSSPSAQSGKLLVKVQLQYLTCPSDNLDISTTPFLTARKPSSTLHSTAHVTPPNTSGRRTTSRANTADNMLPISPDPCLSKRIKEVTVSEITTSSLLVNWNVLEDLGDEYELWYTTGTEAQSLRMIGGVREVELSELKAGAVYKICVVPQSSNINKCLQPTANQCTEAHTQGLPGNTQPVQSGDKKGQYAQGAGIAVTVILLIVIALIVAFKLKSKRTGFQRHYDEDMSMYIEHFETDPNKMDFDQINSAFENILDEDM